MHLVNKIRLGLSILVMAISTQSALAANDWQINSTGNGVSGASSVSALNVGGVGFVQLLPDAKNPTVFTFVEHGAYQALASDGTSPFGSHDLTVSYTVSGTGSFLDPGAMRMSAGRITLYSDATFDFATMAANYGADNGTKVASFDIVDGYVANAQGQVVVQAKGVAGSFAQGYLFNSGGTDMATLQNIQLQLALLNQPIMPNVPMIAGVVCGIAAACPGGEVTLSPLAFTVQDAGSVSISAVPEPETSAMLLAGLGLIAAVARRRRR
jgi:hypothetical protein